MFLCVCVTWHGTHTHTRTHLELACFLHFILFRAATKKYATLFCARFAAAAAVCVSHTQRVCVREEGMGLEWGKKVHFSLPV